MVHLLLRPSIHPTKLLQFEAKKWSSYIAKFVWQKQANISGFGHRKASQITLTKYWVICKETFWEDISITIGTR